MEILYNIIKQLSKKYNKDGRILTTENKVADRWKTHFEEALNRIETKITDMIFIGQNYLHFNKKNEIFLDKTHLH